MQDFKQWRYWFLGLLVLWLLSSLTASAAQAAQTDRGLNIRIGRGQEVDAVFDSDGKPLVLYEGSHALVIGISNYTNGWPQLPGVLKDVEAVKTALEAQGFHVVLHTDLDKNGLDQAFTDFISQYGQDPENRLLFYFAGHGHTVETSYGEELGYIVPVDAPNPNYDLPVFQSKAMEMQQIEIYAKRIQSKHALFLFDACFSGSLFALSRAVPEVINYKTAQPVRQFITSGSADETVPDESIFRAQFARAIQGEADSDQDGYVTGTELGEYLQRTVVNYSRNAQHPQYGKIRNPNLDKGDFVFLIPTDEEEQVPTFEAPSDTSFSLEDLTKAAAEEQAHKAAWQTRLEKMEQALQQVKEYELQDISKDLKIEAWQRFVDAFSEENPYATRDNEILDFAQQRMDYWRDFTPPPTPTPSSVFRLNGVTLYDADGQVIEPVDDIYTLERGETVTITVDVEAGADRTVEFAWTTGNGKVPSRNSPTNTYTATTTGSDYVTVYVWDTATGEELPVLPINLDVVSADELETPVVEDETEIEDFYVDNVLVTDEQQNILEPDDEIYVIRNGETVTMSVEVVAPPDYNVTFAWTTGRGRVPVSDQHANTYTATELGGDYVIVYIWDAVTGKELPDFPINITVVPE